MTVKCLSRQVRGPAFIERTVLSYHWSKNLCNSSITLTCAPGLTAMTAGRLTDQSNCSLHTGFDVLDFLGRCFFILVRQWRMIEQHGQARPRGTDLFVPQRQDWNVRTPIFDRPAFFHRSALDKPKMEKRTTDLDTLHSGSAAQLAHPPHFHQPALLQPASNLSTLTALRGVTREGKVILKPREII